jgi:ubiquitin C-terminal hydrolase
MERRVVCGLLNTSSTCYLNTIIQCFRSCDILCHFFKYAPVIINTKNQKLGGPCLIQSLRLLLHEMDRVGGDSVCIRPESFLNAFAATVPFMDVHNQNDMHEALLVLLNRINDEICVSVSGEEMSCNSSKDALEALAERGPKYGKLKAKCDSGWVNMLSKEYSLLVDLIYGQQIIQIICGACGYNHHNYQPFNVLEVPVIGKSIEDCLQGAFNKEKMNATPEMRETDGWKCSKCNAIAESEKSTHLWKLPPVLAVCLKRFVYNPRLKRMVKNTASIEISDTIKTYPISQSLSSAPRIYNLKAIGHHHGGLDSGHYFASCKMNEKWHVLNDMHISEKMDSSDNDTSYMVFYELDGGFSSN